MKKTILKAQEKGNRVENHERTDEGEEFRITFELQDPHPQQILPKHLRKNQGLCGEYRKMIPNLRMAKSSQQCTICIEKFEPGQVIKQLPCRHILHRLCGKQWLKVNHTCPVCRLDLRQYFDALQKDEVRQSSSTDERVLDRVIKG